jgi:hypothetical protein
MKEIQLSHEEAWALKEQEEFEKSQGIIQIQQLQKEAKEIEVALEEERKVNEKMIIKTKDTEEELRWTLSKSFHLSEVLSITEKQLYEAKQKIQDLTDQMRNMELKSVQLKFQLSRVDEEKRGIIQTNTNLLNENRELRKELSKFKPKLEPKTDQHKMANLATTLNTLVSLKHKF